MAILVDWKVLSEKDRKKQPSLLKEKNKKSVIWKEIYFLWDRSENFSCYEWIILEEFDLEYKVEVVCKNIYSTKKKQILKIEKTRTRFIN